MPTTHSWPPPELIASPWFACLQDILKQLAWQQFPQACDYACIPAALQPNNEHGLPIRFIAPNDPSIIPPGGASSYEAAIWRHGLVSTRQENWHDLFNLLCWLAWPKTKAAMNAMHWRVLADETSGHRTRRRDAATLLDESGAILACCKQALADACINHDWNYLFCQQRQAWGEQVTLLPIGHALFEKGLSPFIGIVSKILIMQVDPAFFRQTLPEQRRIADVWCADWLALDRLTTPRQLPPLPVLGIPGWWAEQDAAFYANHSHFRPARQP